MTQRATPISNAVLAAALLALSACGGSDPKGDGQKVEEAKQAVTLGSIATDALHFVGLLPKYECGKPEREFATQIAEGLKVKLGCTVWSDDNSGGGADMFNVHFGNGCKVEGKALSGTIHGLISGGDDHEQYSVDLKDVLVGKDNIPATVGYETCGDEDRYSAFVEATLSNEPQRIGRLDLKVANRDGIPLIGEQTFILDGEGGVEHPKGTDKLTFSHLTYEMKQLMPWDGSLQIDTSDGHLVKATFDSTKAFYRTGTLTVQVDDHAPIKVPVVR